MNSSPHIIGRSISAMSPNALVTIAQPHKTLVPPKNLIKNLRQKGFKIRVKHYRFAAVHAEQLPPVTLPPVSTPYFLTHITNENRKNFDIHTNGGRTEVEVTKPSGETFRGESVCAFADTYFKRLGVYLAVTRALKPDEKKDKPDSPVRRIPDFPCYFNGMEPIDLAVLDKHSEHSKRQNEKNLK